MDWLRFAGCLACIALFVGVVVFWDFSRYPGNDD